ncbi:acyl-CoA dehydrogenase [Branchiibius cervicis]|uniref:Acyl-CoA dehydrogenase n=1 Tax=Branchiibius cervicis TaxID=908252 RepID=A0ABW2APF5_9MICO
MSSTLTETAAPADARADELRALLDGPWRELRDRFRAEIEPQMVLAEPGRSIEENRARVTRQLLSLAEKGYGRVGFLTEYGGEYDYGASCVLFEMQAYGDLSLTVKTGVQFGLFGGAVQRLGTQRHHAAYLEDIMTGKLLGSFAMTEEGHGSNVQRLETTLTYDVDAGDFVLHSPTPSSIKTYIGNAARDAQMAVVFAQLVVPAGAQGVHAVLVSVRDGDGRPLPGVTIGDNGPKAGLPGVDNGTFLFDQVRVPRENLLNAYGDVAADGSYTSPIKGENKRFFTMLGTLVRGRVCVGGGAAASAKKALVIALRYGTRRRQFEAPSGEQENVILDYLAHQRKLFPRLARSYALSFAQNELTSRLQALQGEGAQPDEQGQRELEGLVAGMKALSTWHAIDTIQTCREACGGAGYISENELGQMRADTDVFATFEGDNTVLLQLVAKGLLTEYKETFSDLDAADLVGLITRQVGNTLVEKTAGRAGLQKLVDAVTPRNDETALDNRGWQLWMFRERADHLLETVGMRLRRATRENAFELFNNAQDHVLAAARAYIEEFILTEATAAWQDMPQGPARDMLSKVIDLYALSSIETDKGWFLEHGRLTDKRSRLVTATVNDLCQALRPEVDTLTRALGVPEQLIVAPIVRN